MSGTRTRGNNKAVGTFAIIGLGVMGFAFVVAAIISAVLGRAVMALLFTASAAVWFPPFAQRLCHGTFTERIESDAGGTTFRPARAFDSLSAAMALTALIVFLAWGLVAMFDIDAISFVEEIRPGFIVGAFIWAALSAALLLVIVKNGGMMYVRLTLDGFVFFAAGLRTGRGEWAQITRITDVMPEADPHALCPIAVVLADGRIPTVADADFVAVSGDALRELMRFYWQHPEHRVELTDDRAARRLLEN